MVTIKKALIIKYITEDGDDDNTTGFMLEPVGDVTPVDVATTLCATFLQMSFKAGKDFEESKEVLLDLLDDMKDIDFNESENLH